MTSGEGPSAAERIFLSEHDGDARPDTLIYLHVSDVEPIAAEFGATPHRRPWGPELELRDVGGVWAQPCTQVARSG